MISGRFLIFLCIKAIIPGQCSTRGMGLANSAQQMFYCSFSLLQERWSYQFISHQERKIKDLALNHAWLWGEIFRCPSLEDYALFCLWKGMALEPLLFYHFIPSSGQPEWLQSPTLMIISHSWECSWGTNTWLSWPNGTVDVSWGEPLFPLDLWKPWGRAQASC